MPNSMRIPGLTSRISDNWAVHIRRGSLGGTDYVDGYGTPVHAMASGTVVGVDNSPDGSGGRVVTIRHDDGEQTQCLHMSSITAVRGQRVNRGDVVGYSGASAYGSNWGTGGPHIHAHGIRTNGARFDVEPYVDGNSDGGNNSGAGNGSTPITQEEDMPKMIRSGGVDALVGPGTLFKSPNQDWTNFLKSRYGDSFDTGDDWSKRAIELMANGIPEKVWDQMAPGEAFTWDRGIFNPAADFVAPRN